jgi:hypothetical protein
MFGIRTSRVSAAGTPQLQRTAASIASRSWARTIGIFARSRNVLVRTFS